MVKANIPKNLLFLFIKLIEFLTFSLRSETLHTNTCSAIQSVRQNLKPVSSLE